MVSVAPIRIMPYATTRSCARLWAKPYIGINMLLAKPADHRSGEVGDRWQS